MTGPDLDYGIHGGASVQYGQSFIIVGGHTYDPTEILFDNVLRFDPATETWQEVSGATMAEGREYFAAFLVPDDYGNCQ